MKYLIDDERGRYHFEIAEVIKTGEKVVRSMPDAPPLSRFALGALYYSIGDHNGAVEQLGFAAEEEVLKESRHVSPSRQLRRYVQQTATDRTPAEALRKIKRRDRQPGTNASGARRAAACGKPTATQDDWSRPTKARMSEQIRSPRRDLPISATARLSPSPRRRRFRKF